MVDNLSFHQMDLDPRLLKAIAKLGWDNPTAIQEKAIPLALEGKDLIVRAKTGSGKTAGYSIPLIHKILKYKDNNKSTMKPFIHALVMIPTKELSQQATKHIKDLCSFCSRDVKVVGVSHVMSSSSQRVSIMECPDVVVGTPAMILTHLVENHLVIDENFQMIVFDEADLLFSFGYENDIKEITKYLPVAHQAILMSATLNEEILSLKKLVLHQPVTLKLEEADIPEETRLTQYHIKCDEEDRFLLIYTLLKLKLVRGKTLIFVNDISNSYRLKLFLEQFSVKSGVLNSELPHNSRYHAVEEFNKGIYDIIIATDEVNSYETKSKKGKFKSDKEYGVSRGIDFQNVENVINFDFPPTVDSYIHRVGRTARGFDYGTSLTFVSSGEEERLIELERALQEPGRDPLTDASTQRMIKPYRFKMSEIEGFRYRVSDAYKNVSALSIKEARLKEIRAELLSSQKLKDHFDDNPRDLQVLRHDRVLLPHKVKDHLKYIPPYLLPKAMYGKMSGATASSTDGSVVNNGGSITGKVQSRSRQVNKKPTSISHKYYKGNDPLKSFKVRGTKRKLMNGPFAVSDKRRKT